MVDLEERDIVRHSHRRLLNAIIGYCRTTDCLHHYIVRYFADPDSVGVDGTDDGGVAAKKADGTFSDCKHKENCGNCFNCESTFETIDVSDVARAVSRCVHDIHQSFGMGKIVSVLRGSKAQDLLARGFDRVPSYAALHDVPDARIRDVINQMVTDGYLTVSEGRLPVVGFGPRAAQTVQPDFHYEIKRVQRKTSVEQSSGSYDVDAENGSVSHTGKASRDEVEFNEDDEALFQKFRELRRTIAQEIGKPPYIVFSDKTLHDMARIKPVTDAQFLAVNGVGENKLHLYGPRFMEVVRSNQ